MLRKKVAGVFMVALGFLFSFLCDDAKSQIVQSPNGLVIVLGTQFNDTLLTLPVANTKSHVFSLNGTSVLIEDPTTVLINMQGGHDILEFRSLTTSGSVSVLTETGNDVVRFIPFDPIFLDGNIGGDFLLDMGRGNNQVSFFGYHVQGDTTLIGGRHRDAISLRASTFEQALVVDTQEGADNFELFDLARVEGDTQIEMGTGTDAVRLDGSFGQSMFFGDLSVNLGDATAASSDTMDVTTLVAEGDITIDGEDMSQEIFFNLVRCFGSLSINTRRGTDGISLMNSLFTGSNFSIRSGADADNVSLTNATINPSISVKLGGGNDDIVLNSCTLRASKTSGMIWGEGGSNSITELSPDYAGTLLKIGF